MTIIIPTMYLTTIKKRTATRTIIAIAAVLLFMILRRTPVTYRVMTIIATSARKDNITDINVHGEGS